MKIKPPKHSSTTLTENFRRFTCEYNIYNFPVLYLLLYLILLNKEHPCFLRFSVDCLLLIQPQHFGHVYSSVLIHCREQ